MALEIITSNALAPTRHGFFTRKGGASSGLFAALNCGLGSADQTAVVDINRARVARAMGVAPEDIAAISQIHSATVANLSAPSPRPTVQADAMVTATPGLVLLILTADCAPVLFADPKAGVIGAAHAGWRGALGGVLENTIDAMEALGANREDITAVVGPTISQSAYEVGQEFLEQFLDEDPNYARFFVNGAEGKYQFDLPLFACNALRAHGIGHAEWSRHCTYNDAERFFSYRRSFHHGEPDYGRLASAIRL